MSSNSPKNEFYIRFATREDVPIILEFIYGLAEYEHMIDQVVATEEFLETKLFDEQKAEVILGIYQQKPVCFALFFHNFSTFLGKSGIYIEDLFVLTPYRRKGLGKKLLTYLANLALQRDCKRLDWACHDWNEPSIRFYKELGAIALEDLTIYRMQDEGLRKLAHNPS